jgi:hypothetical protein
MAREYKPSETRSRSGKTPAGNSYVAKRGKFGNSKFKEVIMKEPSKDFPGSSIKKHQQTVEGGGKRLSIVRVSPKGSEQYIQNKMKKKVKKK